MENMENIQEYLKSISTESLMKLSSESDAMGFDEISPIRELVKKYKLSTTGNFLTGVIGLRHQILVEITRRYFGSLS